MSVLETGVPHAAHAHHIHSFDGLPLYNNITAALSQEITNDSVHVIYPERLKQNAYKFLNGFSGRSLYAIKAHPHPTVLRTLYNAGIRDFDVASLREVELVHNLLPDANLYFMHPVKSRHAIREAYRMGVRAFSLDHVSELDKILTETGHAQDLQLFLRLDVVTMGAQHDLSGKFGANAASAVLLMQRIEQVSAKLGICFHVGSQSLRTEAFSEALSQVANLIKTSGVEPDVLDVGGGFPVAYPGMTPPPLEDYFTQIMSSLRDYGLDKYELMCEPGRALVAEAGAVAARVELRKGNSLYLNDGTYGSLFDAGHPNWPFHVSVNTKDGRMISSETQDYIFFGPTCDSLDTMDGPFKLSVDVDEGDWVIFDNIGAYGYSLQSRFNGFYSETVVAVAG